MIDFPFYWSSLGTGLRCWPTKECMSSHSSGRWTREDVQRVIMKQAKPSKYRNVKTTVDGITFDSKKEAQHYHALKLRERAGEVRGIRCHVPHALLAWHFNGAIGGSVEVGKYEADFVYEERLRGGAWCIRVDDVKGMKTLPLARWKQKHFTAQYGLEVREVRS